jgi:hypothetical protein
MPTDASTKNPTWNFELAGWKAILAAVVNIAGFIAVLVFPDAENAVSIASAVCLALAFWPIEKLFAKLGQPGSALGLYVVGHVVWAGLTVFKPSHPLAYAMLAGLGGPLVGGLWLGGLFALQARALPKGARLFAGLLFVSSLCLLPFQLAFVRAGFDVERLVETVGPGPAAAVFIAALTSLVTQVWMFFVLARIYFRVQPEHLARVASVDKMAERNV